jgi:DNA-binding NtrC family response regulator
MSTIAVIDDDITFLQKIESNYSECGLSITVFRYPDELDYFYKASKKFDVILIGHRLGGSNGANVFKKLLAKGIDGTIIVMSNTYDEHYSNFEYYVSKDDILNNPDGILGKKNDIVEQAVEASVLLQKRTG